MKYRAEIDGLRALAVIPVILFHAGFELFSGGFVGVDIFFVISGYLITTILIEDIENKRFSIVNFYERRARRILPALFVVALTALIFALLFFSEIRIQAFAKSLITTIFFTSNFYFWKSTDYFALSAEYEPLLHTWSLAIEEQYYLLFPIFLGLVWRFGKYRVFWMIVVFAALSLALSEWGWRNKAVANFYLAPTRAWELFAGSIAAFIVQKRGVQANNALALLGLVAIMFAIFIYNDSTPFPSVYALMPVIGTVLLVLFADKETLVAKLLSTKPLVGIGLISYSAYLWHQPLLAFYKFNKFSTFSSVNTVEISLLIVVLVIMAFLTWKYVEKPFRDRDSLLWTQKNIFRFSVFGFVMFTLASLVLVLHPMSFQETLLNEPEHRYPIKILKNKEAFDLIGLEKHSKFNETTIFQPLDGLQSCRVLILGDSHAGHLKGFAEVITAKLFCQVDMMISSDCPPLFGYFRTYSSDPPRQLACTTQTGIWANFVKQHGDSYDVIVLASRWNVLVGDKKYDRIIVDQSALLPNNGEGDQIDDAQRFENLAVAIQSTVRDIHAAGSTAFIIPQVPLQLLDLRDHSNVEAYKLAAPLRSEALIRQNNFDQVIHRSGVSQLEKFEYMRTFDFFCPAIAQHCANVFQDKSLYRDDDHLSLWGSYVLGERFVEQYRNYFQ